MGWDFRACFVFFFGGGGENIFIGRTWRIPPRFDGMEIFSVQVKDDQKKIPSGGPNISPKKWHLEDDFPFPLWWDMYPSPGGTSSNE